MNECTSAHEASLAQTRTIADERSEMRTHAPTTMTNDSQDAVHAWSDWPTPDNQSQRPGPPPISMYVGWAGPRYKHEQ